MTNERVPALVETGWLAEHLDDPNLRVLESTVFLKRDPETGVSSIESGRDEWAAGHIPGSAFADIIEDLSETDNPRFRFEAPSAEKLAKTLGALGIGDDSRVVIYDRAGNAWAARVWWMLRSAGFDNAGVLNGGWTKWTAEGRPISTERPSYPTATLTPKPRPELFAQKDDVLAAIEDGVTCIVNALSPANHSGEELTYNGRRGHIPTAVNVPSAGPTGIVDPATMTYLPAADIRRRFEESGALSGERVISYCGGGIAASSTAFALHLIGVDDVAVYDGSLTEWTADENLPLVTD
jgi:thiosulfate/3-mercaptopyruvate sulfurtransferase